MIIKRIGTLGPRKVISAFSVVSITLTATMGAGHPAAASATDQRNIEQIVLGAQIAEQRLCMPPLQYRRAVGAIPHTEVAAANTRIQMDESSFYTGSMLSDQIALLQRNCTAALTSGQVTEIDGGVDSMTFDQVSVQGNDATASGHEIKWLKSLVSTSTGVRVASARALESFSSTLLRTSEGWRITDEALHFAPGNGP